MAKPCSLATMMFLTYTIFCFLHSVYCEETADEPGAHPIPEEEFPLDCTDSDDVDCSRYRVGRSKHQSALEIQCRKASGETGICEFYLGKKRAAPIDQETRWRRGDVVSPINRRFSKPICQFANPLCKMGRLKRKFALKKKTVRVPGWKLGGKSDDPSEEKCNALDLTCIGKRSIQDVCTDPEMMTTPFCRAGK